MNLSTAADLLKHFETQKVINYLGQMDVGQLVRNPWLLGSIGVLALVSLIMHWRLLLVTLVGLTGFVWLVSYVHQRGTTLTSLSNGNLLLFVGGGVTLIGLMIYFLFIRTD